MKLSYILTTFTAAIVMAVPNPAPEEAQSLEPRGCLPSSCNDFGVSGMPPKQ
ncbi:hypothetical protein IMZ48_37070 [Candidatus Bathyarchaeota archaeon]|nr:hypothetical protein [Candidatus Bathyarchaeota archaeon]